MNIVIQSSYSNIKNGTIEYLRSKIIELLVECEFSIILLNCTKHNAKLLKY